MNRGAFAHLGGRLLQSLLVLWVVITLLFLLFRLAPGNPLVAYIDPTFTEEQQEALLRRFGLDKPLHIQYVVYLGNIAKGDFGDSFFQPRRVNEIIMEVLPNTLYLTFTALIIAALWAHMMSPGWLITLRTRCKTDLFQAVVRTPAAAP